MLPSNDSLNLSPNPTPSESHRIPLSPSLNYSLQLPRIPNRVLNNLPASYQDFLLGPYLLALLLQRKIDAAITHEPATAASEVDHAAFAVEEEEVFGVGDGERGVGFFGAGGDFRANRAYEDLFVCERGEGRGLRNGW